MKLTLRAAGRIRSGPQRTLVDDYLKRANTLARRVGILDVCETEIDTRSHKTRTQTTRALLDIPNECQLVILDETGQDITSRALAKTLRQWQNSGVRDVCFIIGDADGFDASLLPKHATKWRFGRQTWPHKLVRVMLSEQIYRALSILANTPYHRD